jgi:hypothetical protein
MIRSLFFLIAGTCLWGQFRMQEIGNNLGVVYAVRLADVNGDGKQDVVAITGGKVIWYQNPSWEAHVISEKVAPMDHVSIAGHDINGDGLLDFALAAEWQPRERVVKGSMHWLEQLPGGKWKLHDIAKVPGAHRIRWGDVTGDGKKDLVVMPLEGKALVYQLPDWRVETAAENLELAHNLFLEDMNDDGVLDIVMASKRGVETLSRQKDGTWKRVLSGEGQPGEIVIGRVNRYRVAATIEAFHGDTLTVYEEPRPKLNPQGQPPPANWHRELGTLWPKALRDNTVYGGHALGWADFDGDGSDELAFGFRGKETGIAILKRDGEGKWNRTVRVDEAQMSPEDLVTGDLNGDGKPEVIACGRATQNVRIYWNEWAPKWVRHEIAQGQSVLTAVGIQLNGGGRAVIASRGEQAVLYGPGKVLHDGVAIIHSAVIDVDGDGDEDFVGARYSPGLVYWLEQPAKPLEQDWKYHVVDDQIDGVHGLYAHDIDRDGKLDLVANSAQPKGPFANSVVWLKALDRGRKWKRTVFANGDAPGLGHYHGAGDLNGDGRADIVSAAKTGKDGEWFAWWEQPRKEGKWTKHVLATGEDGATNPLVADVNGDGKMDVIASRGHGIGLLWFEGPRFEKHSIDTSLFGPHSLAVGDIDGDGDVDAVTCAKDSFVVAWFENGGKGNFVKRVIHENQAAYDIRLVDLDRDGDLDVLVAGQNSKNVVWWENRLKASKKLP